MGVGTHHFQSKKNLTKKNLTKKNEEYRNNLKYSREQEEGNENSRNIDPFDVKAVNTIKNEDHGRTVGRNNDYERVIDDEKDDDVIDDSGDIFDDRIESGDGDYDGDDYDNRRLIDTSYQKNGDDLKGYQEHHNEVEVGNDSKNSIKKKKYNAHKYLSANYNQTSKLSIKTSPVTNQMDSPKNKTRKNENKPLAKPSKDNNPYLSLQPPILKDKDSPGETYVMYDDADNIEGNTLNNGSRNSSNVSTNVKEFRDDMPRKDLQDSGKLPPVKHSIRNITLENTSREYTEKFLSNTTLPNVTDSPIRVSRFNNSVIPKRELDKEHEKTNRILKNKTNIISTGVKSGKKDTNESSDTFPIAGGSKSLVSTSQRNKTNNIRKHTDSRIETIHVNNDSNNSLTFEKDDVSNETLVGKPSGDITSGNLQSLRTKNAFGDIIPTSGTDKNISSTPLHLEHDVVLPSKSYTRGRNYQGDEISKPKVRGDSNPRTESNENYPFDNFQSNSKVLSEKDSDNNWPWDIIPLGDNVPRWPTKEDTFLENSGFGFGEASYHNERGNKPSNRNLSSLTGNSVENGNIFSNRVQSSGSLNKSYHKPEVRANGRQRDPISKADNSSAQASTKSQKQYSYSNIKTASKLNHSNLVENEAPKRNKTGNISHTEHMQNLSMSQKPHDHPTVLHEQQVVRSHHSEEEKKTGKKHSPAKDIRNSFLHQEAIDVTQPEKENNERSQDPFWILGSGEDLGDNPGISDSPFWIPNRISGASSVEINPFTPFDTDEGQNEEKVSDAEKLNAKTSREKNKESFEKSTAPEDSGKTDHNFYIGKERDVNLKKPKVLRTLNDGNVKSDAKDESEKRHQKPLALEYLGKTNDGVHIGKKPAGKSMKPKVWTLPDANAKHALNTNATSKVGVATNEKSKKQSLIKKLESIYQAIMFNRSGHQRHIHKSRNTQPDDRQGKVKADRVADKNRTTQNTSHSGVNIPNAELKNTSSDGGISLKLNQTSATNQKESGSSSAILADIDELLGNNRSAVSKNNMVKTMKNRNEVHQVHEGGRKDANHGQDLKETNRQENRTQGNLIPWRIENNKMNGDEIGDLIKDTPRKDDLKSMSMKYSGDGPKYRNSSLNRSVEKESKNFSLHSTVKHKDNANDEMNVAEDAASQADTKFELTKRPSADKYPDKSKRPKNFNIQRHSSPKSMKNTFTTHSGQGGISSSANNSGGNRSTTEKEIHGNKTGKKRQSKNILIPTKVNKLSFHNSENNTIDKKSPKMQSNSLSDNTEKASKQESRIADQKIRVLKSGNISQWKRNSSAIHPWALSRTTKSSPNDNDVKEIERKALRPPVDKNKSKLWGRNEHGDIIPGKDGDMSETDLTGKQSFSVNKMKNNINDVKQREGESKVPKSDKGNQSTKSIVVESKKNPDASNLWGKNEDGDIIPKTNHDWLSLDDMEDDISSLERMTDQEHKDKNNERFEDRIEARRKDALDDDMANSKSSWLSVDDIKDSGPNSGDENYDGRSEVIANNVERDKILLPNKKRSRIPKNQETKDGQASEKGTQHKTVTGKTKAMISNSPLLHTPLYPTNPTISVKVTARDKSSPSEEDGEDVTSNDTIPVSNETEAELTVNETGPGYFDLKENFSANSTQEIEEIPGVFRHEIPDGKKDISIGKYYSNNSRKKSKNPTLVENEYAMNHEKEEPEDFHFEEKKATSRDDLKASYIQNDERKKPTILFQNNKSAETAGRKTHESRNSKEISNVNSTNSRKSRRFDTISKKNTKTADFNAGLHPPSRGYSYLKPKPKERVTKTHEKLFKNTSSVDRNNEFDPFSKIEPRIYKSTATLLKPTAASKYLQSSLGFAGTTTQQSAKLKSDDGNKFAKVLKRVEKMLRKSRASRRNHIQRMRKLVHNLGRLAQFVKPNINRESDVSVLNAAKHIDSRLSGIEKRMHIAGGSEILNNITTVLVELMEKIQGNVRKNSTTSSKSNDLANRAPKKINFVDNHNLKMSDMIYKMKHLESVFQKHLKEEKLATCKLTSSVLEKMSLTRSLGELKHTSHGIVETIQDCVEICCRSERCDLAFLMNRECFGFDCKHQTCLLTPVAKKTDVSIIALLTKRISADIGFSGIPNSDVPAAKCEVQPHFIKDSVLGEGGLKGNATVLKHVTDAWSCGIECCKVTSCNVAIIQEGVCYIVSCQSDGPCFEFEHSQGQKTSLAFVRRTGTKEPQVKSHPTQTALGIKEPPVATSVIKNSPKVLAASTMLISSSTSSQLPKSHAWNKKDSSVNSSTFQHKLTQKGQGIHLVASDAPTPSRGPKTSGLANDTSLNTCVQIFSVSNVTLRAGFSAGNFKFGGKVRDSSTCVDDCCRNKDCNVAFVLQNMCFLVTCTSNKLCQNEPLFSNVFESTLVYVARSSLEADMVKQELVPTLKRRMPNPSVKSEINQLPDTKANISQPLPTHSECSAVFIASDAKLFHGFESGEIVVEGRLKGGINECISKCCAYNGCNATFVIEDQCFLVRCYSKESCRIVVSDSGIPSSVAIITRQSADHSLSYLSPLQPVNSEPQFMRSNGSHMEQNISPGNTYHLTSDEKKSSKYSSSEAKVSSSLSHPQIISATPIPTKVITAHSSLVFKTNKQEMKSGGSPSAHTLVIDSPTDANTGSPNAQKEMQHFTLDGLVESNVNTKSLKINPASSVIDAAKTHTPQSDNKLKSEEILKQIQDGLDKLNQAEQHQDDLDAVRGSHKSNQLNTHHGKGKTYGLEKGKTSDGNPDSSNLKNHVGKTKEENTKVKEVIGKIESEKSSEMIDPKTSIFDELISKMNNLSLEQRELKKNIPDFNQIVGKIQRDLERNTSSKEIKDSVIQHRHFSNFSVISPVLPGKALSTKKPTIIPTPKLVQSPPAVVTSPSVVSLPQIRSTSLRAPTTSVKTSHSDELSKYTRENTDIGKEVVLALKKAGMIPIKPVQRHSVIVVNPYAEQKHVKKTLPKSKSQGKSSAIPAAQRLLNFLEEQIRQKTAHSENTKPEEVTTEPLKKSKDSKQIKGLLDIQTSLNERIRNLESEIHQIKSNKSVQASETKLKMKPSVVKTKTSEKIPKINESSKIVTPVKRLKSPRKNNDRSYLIEQLRSIVHSELKHNKPNVSPISKNPDSTIRSPAAVERNMMKNKEVALEHNLNRLYSNAVAEMEKALESSGGDNHLQNQQGVKKNQIHAAENAEVLQQVPKKISVSNSGKHKLLDTAVDIPEAKKDKEIASGKFDETKISPKKDVSLSIKAEKILKTNISSEESEKDGTKLSAETPGKFSKNTMGESPEEKKQAAGHNGVGFSPPKDHPSHVESDTGTCHHSNVQIDVTLKGGIAREGVQDGGIVADMHECTQRCCRNEKCNVAFMLKNNCFLLPCTDTKLCQAVKLPTNSLHTKLTFMNRDSETNMELKMFDNIVDGLSSSAGEESPKEKDEDLSLLNSARKEELSKDKENSKVSNPSVQALIDEMNLLTTHDKLDENGGKITTGSEKQHHLPSKIEPGKFAQKSRERDPLEKPSSKPKLCPVTEVEYNTTIRGGLAAVDYKYGGKVADINDCVSLCCKSDSCSIAFMFSDECFLLVCKSEHSCESVQAESTALNPRIVRLFKASAQKLFQKLPEPSDELKEALNSGKEVLTFEKPADDDSRHKTEPSSSCLRSDPITHVVPDGGLRPGHYKDFGKVQLLRECVDFCCRWKRCNMSFMILNGCFGVACENNCNVVPSGDLTFQSKVVYMKRRSDVIHWLNSKGSSRSTVPSTSHKNTDAENAFKFGNEPVDSNVDTGPTSYHERNVDVPTMKSSTSKDMSASGKTSHKTALNDKSLQPSRESEHTYNSKEPTSVIKNAVLNTIYPHETSEESTISKDKRGDGIKPQINVKAAVEPKFSARNEEKGVCVPGEVEHDVTLGGGIKAGSYTEQGEVLNMDECVEWCCKQRKCDVAMVIKAICYTVTCYDRKSCVSVPVRRIQYHPSLVHVRRVKRGVVHDDGYLSTDTDNDVSLQEIVEGSKENSRTGHGSFVEDSNFQSDNSKIEDELVDMLTEQREPEDLQEQKGSGNQFLSTDTGGQSSDVPYKHQGMERTAPSWKATYDVSRDRDINIKPSQASRRPLGMSTDVDPPSCLHNPISYNVTLRQGLRSGQFKDQGRVDNFDTCFRHCCHDDECNLVFMMRNYCYLISCYDHDSCALKPLLSTSDMEIAVAFVYKEDTNKLMKWDKASMNHMSSLPVPYQKNEGFRNIPNFVTDNQPSSRSSDRNPNIESPYQELKPINPDPPHLYEAEREPIRNFENPRPSNKLIRTRSFSNSIPPARDFTPDVNAPPYESHSLTCTPGSDRYFTTLRGGLNPGYFIDIGLVSSMEVCKQYCCRKSDCDVAMMQQERCYLVTCPRRELCEDVKTSTSSENTRISHIFREERSSVAEEDVNPGRNEALDGRIHDNWDSNGIGDIRDDIRGGRKGNKDMYGFSAIHDGFVGDGFNGDVNTDGRDDFRATREGIGSIRVANGGIRDDADTRVGEGIVRDIDGVRGNNRAVLGREGVRSNIEIQGDNLVDREDEDPLKKSRIYLERKDTIPNGYRGNEIPSGSSRNDHGSEEEVDLLRDAIADIEKKKHLGNEDESYELRSTSDIPTPTAQSETDLEKLIDKGRQGPLIFDDSAGKRQHNQQREGLGDMASDILSNILQHRTHDTIESIWSHDKDPLQNEISRAKEINTPEKIEKELHQTGSHDVFQSQNHITDNLRGESVSQGDHGSITGNSGSNLGSQGTPNDYPSTGSTLDDQSKLIETLYNLVKQNIKAPNPNNQGSSHEQDTAINDLPKEKQNSESHSRPHQEASSHKINVIDNQQKYPNDGEDDYSNYLDQDYVSRNPNNAHIKDSHPKKFATQLGHKNRPKLREDGDNFDYKDYDDANVIEDELADLDTPKYENEGSETDEIRENSDQKSHNMQNAGHGVGKKVLDQDLDFISDNLNDVGIQNENEYGENDEINDDNVSEYDDGVQDYEPNMDYYSTLGVKRKLLHSHPTKLSSHSPGMHRNQYRKRLDYARLDSKGKPSILWNNGRFLSPHSERGNPLAFREEKQPLGQENENLVMGELEKIEDEIADIKSPPKAQSISEHEILKPENSTTSKIESKSGDQNKQSIVDILAGLKDVSKLGFETKGKKLNQTDGLHAVKSEDDMILKKLNEIKTQIRNISKPKKQEDSKKSKDPSKMDDIGDEISELLGEDWLLDKRSHIPRPTVKHELQGVGWRNSFINPRSHSVKVKNIVDQNLPNLGREVVAPPTRHQLSNGKQQYISTTPKMPELESPLPTLTPHHDRLAEKSAIPQPKQALLKTSKLDPSTIGNLMSPVGKSKIHTKSTGYRFSHTKNGGTPNTPQNPFIPFSNERDDILSRYSSLRKMHHDAMSGGKAKDRQLKAVIPSPADPAEEQPSFQDIHDMIEFNKKRKEYSKKGKIPNLLVHLSFENTSGLTVMDDSGTGHDGEISGAILIRPFRGKCGSIANFNGGKILFNPKTFRTKPRKAITVALWVKLDKFTDSISLFSVQRSPSGQGGKIDLRVSANHVWWAHVDENRKLIFDSTTRSSLISAGHWAHIAATYDAEVHSVKILVNGRLVNEDEASGLISQKWLGDVGIGLLNSLHGNVDEFYLYDRALTTPEISRLRHKCHTLLVSKKKNADSVTNSLKQSTITTGNTTPSSHHKTTHSITPNTCSQGTFHVNSTLQGGRNAGRFDFKGKVKNVLQCVTKCCNVKDCDLAYLDMGGSCYAVHCKRKGLCKAVPAIGGESSSVFFVSREKHLTEAKAQSKKKHTTNLTSTIERKSNKTANHIAPFAQETSILNNEANLEECKGETVFYNVELKGGLTANSFRRYQHVSSMESCLGYCCDLSDCDLAFVKDGDCFAIHCSTRDMCKVVDGVGKLARVWRQTSGTNTTAGYKGKALVLYFGFHDVSKNIVHDGSGSNNDGKLSKGDQIMAYSRHGPGLDLTEGGVFLKGFSFKGKPKQGISIATWIKLSAIEGTHDIFTSTSSKLRLSKTFYQLRLQDGRILWAHENEIGKNVFMVVSPLVIGPNIWCHVVVTYDSISEKAKVLVNGKVEAVGQGHGKLSGQLGDMTYFGSDRKGTPFNGFLDEIYIFKRPLRNSEVQQYLFNMDSRNYSLNTASKVRQSHNGKDYGALTTKGRYKSVVKLKISDHPINTSVGMNTTGENFDGKPQNSSKVHAGQKLQSKTSPSQRNDTKSQSLFSELQAATGANFAELSCSVNGTVYEKRTFRGGLNSGRFFKIADISNMTSCISQCCKKRVCDAAIMKGRTCFALTCRSKDLCELRPAKLPTFDLKIAFVKRTPKTDQSDKGVSSSGRVVGQSDLRVMLPSNETCMPGMRVANVTINAGVGAGQVVQYRNISKIDECVSQCCSQPKCNTAFLVQDTCYVIACVIKDFCKLRPPPSANFSSEVVYVNRSGVMLFSDPQNALMSPAKDIVHTNHDAMLGLNESDISTILQKISLNVSQSHEKAEKSGRKEHKGAEKERISQRLRKTTENVTQCRVDSIKTDVQLAGELSAGEFVDHGVVRGIKSCIIKCCNDPQCNLTYMIGKKCFAVRCHSAKLCKTVPALPLSVSPTIAHIRQEKLKMSYYVKPGQRDRHKGRPRLKNLLHAWRQLQHYKKVKKKRLKMARHKSRHKTSHKEDQKARHEEKQKHRLEATKIRSKGQVLKDGKHLHLHHHRKIINRNGTRHDHAMQKNRSHEIKSKEKAVSVHGNNIIIKKAHFHCPRKFGCQHSCIYIPDIGYQCTCPAGQILAFDGKHCIKKNTCVFGWHRCQQVCIQLRNKFRCDCDTGYTLNKDRRHCDDIDECLLGIGKCSQHCQNLPGSYSCSCKKGFSLKADKKTCENNHVHSPTTKSHLNRDVLTAPVEVAVQFSEMKVLQGKDAMLNCRARGIPAPTIKWACGEDGALPLPTDSRMKITPQSSLLIEATNISDSGTYYCIASNVMESKSRSVKLDIIDDDECQRKKNPVCQHKCVNTKGSYRCSCHHGYRLRNDSHSCEDIDECSISNHTCSHTCNNTMGSFMCSCPAGYHLIHDGHHECTDIDECNTSAHNCSQLCRNTEGGYQCLCVEGYQLALDNTTCRSVASSAKKVQHASMTKAIGALVSVLAVSILSMVAIAMLLGGFYKGKRRVDLDEQSHGDENTVKPGDKTVLFTWLE
ncbi:uncharacterized protein LOC114526891 [Dendronephthya gigantea]|uniref:uncharacterized protein LOC114526891 n=1 Tax=Dendronephthya gigantea TaxID=151771 RepID=UPI00106A388D|nr:uncharacterized protein LOC114526891 [Dendronephthya gigantea]